MKSIVRGITALTTVVLATVMFASGAQAATPDQKAISDHIGSMRTDYAANLSAQDRANYVTYLSVSDQLTARAQAWANSLAAADTGHSSPDPAQYWPDGSPAYNSIVASWGANSLTAAMNKWDADAVTAAGIDRPLYTTIGTGSAVGKSGTIYVVADVYAVPPPAVKVVPAPVVAVPAPVAIPQPEPVQAAPVEQAPAVQPDPAPAPAAPVVPAPAPEAPKPTEAPALKETQKPTAAATATPTPTPSETASASASATATPESQSVSAMRTSENTSPLPISKETGQAIGLGGGVPVFAGGLVLFLRNRPEKKPLAE